MRKKTKKCVKMLKSKVFLKKTKRGGVLKIVREHYLRDDLICGHPRCNICEENHETEEFMDTEDDYSHVHRSGGNNMKSVSNQLLTSDVYTQFDGKKEEHLLIPDTNVVLHQVCIKSINLLLYSLIKSTFTISLNHCTSLLVR